MSADPDARLRAEQRELALISYDLGTAVVGATEGELTRWSERILSASSLDEVFS